ncbi:MAG: c-type cytochrome [Hyphomicrobiales bacterium]|nr:c-type cytochrome [Hyphomicrobiales bacterium]
MAAPNLLGRRGAPFGDVSELWRAVSKTFRSGAWIYVALALLSSAAFVLVFRAATAQGPDSRPLVSTFQADGEPITPIPMPPPSDPLKLSLGEQLFADPRLSHDGRLTCLTCHDTRANGSSDMRAGDRQSRPHAFNTLSVFDAALNFRLNWEGDFRSLEAHIESLLQDPVKLNTSAAEVVKKLNADPRMTRRFFAAYGRPPDREGLLDALATFERSLLTPDSPFDLWLRGDTSALSAKEVEGYQLFKSFGCISCHQGVNVGGNLFERHGIFRPLASPNPAILRVPSLRNVATRAPYFHDGSAPTLEDAVRKMGAAQLDRTLSGQQVDEIVAFLNSLTGKYRGQRLIGASP